jgi:hypothetical protein
VDPILDISHPDKYLNTANILISSDILEHVMPPHGHAMRGHFRVLKKGGWLILTTPYFIHSAFLEKYPWMVNYEVSSEGTVRGVDSTGETVEIDNPVFHGGPGNTLEMRLFTPEIIVEGLVSAGFKNIEILDQDVEEYGIMRSSTRMGTIIAQKPRRLPFRMQPLNRVRR